MIGEVIGNYKVLEKLGEGAMGTVYKGIDIMVERKVAIKVLRPDIAARPEIVERFRSEAATLAKLNHSSIATLYAFFRHDSRLCMVMEYVPGVTLETKLREHGAFSVQSAVPLFCDVLDAIDYAHHQGVLHRDIKPGNILLMPGGGAKVTDFGIARVLGKSRMTREGNIVGTLEYIAPERIKGQESDFRSDIYSLGAVLFEMLTGRLPFEAETEYALMEAHLKRPVPSFAEVGVEVPTGIQSAVLMAMAKTPDERFASAHEFRVALEQCLTSDRSVAESNASAYSAKPTRLASSQLLGGNADQHFLPTMFGIIRRRGLVAALSTVLLVTLVSVYVFLWNRMPVRRVSPSAPVPVEPVKPIVQDQDRQTVPDRLPAVDNVGDALPHHEPLSKTNPMKPRTPAAAETSSQRHPPVSDKEKRRAEALKLLDQ